MASYHFTVKVGKRGAGASHADYVQRAGTYKNYRDGEDLVHAESANMPQWCIENPSELFRQADINERKNGSSYREFEVAIPREFTTIQQIDFVRDFVQKEIGSKHPVTWAIHNPTASISGGKQPHAHIMFSERMLDGIERDPDQFFKRFDSKIPERGGCQKSKTFSGGLKSEERRSALVDLRRRFADLQNKHLEKHGHNARVSHLSLAAQGIERVPERHLGPIASRYQKNIVLLHEYRNALSLSEFHQQNTSTIDTNISLSAALKERNENERNRAATISRIRNNLQATDNHICQTESNFASLGRPGEILANSSTDYRCNRSVGEITQAVVRQLGRAGEEVARASERIAAIVEERDQPATIPSHQKTNLVTPSAFIEEERKELKLKYEEKGVIQKFDHLMKINSIGRIVEATDHHIVTSLGRGHFGIHNRTEFQCVEYVGTAIADDRFAAGNLVQFNYREKPEQRKAIIQEQRSEMYIKQNILNRDVGR